MFTNVECIVVIENQPKISSILDKYPNNLPYIRIQDVNEFKKILLLHKVNLVCINISFCIGDLISTILYAKEKRIKTFLILPLNAGDTLEYLKLGIDDFVFNKDSKENIEFRILKLLGISKPIEVNVQRYEYITYILPSREVYIKGSKIPLTTFESIFVNFLINNNGYCPMQDFEKHLSNIYGRSIPRKSYVVAISRFKRKVYTCTGYKVIKTRYGFGYVINS